MTLWSISQLLMTGNMLAEVVDPFLTWRQLYTSVKSALTVSSTAEVSHIIFHFILFDTDSSNSRLSNLLDLSFLLSDFITRRYKNFMRH